MHVLLGSNGNITSKAAAVLLDQHLPVRVVGRSVKSLATLEARANMGARPTVARDIQIRVR